MPAQSQEKIFVDYREDTVKVTTWQKLFSAVRNGDFFILE